MTIRVLGGGWYGSHIALALVEDGYDVELHEAGDRLFAGASGANPARLHKGFHYPRSALTRTACREHARAFMELYGELTRSIPVNIYAVAAEDSLVDFGTYQQVMAGEVESLTVHDPAEFGLQQVEGALMTGERHIVIQLARRFFWERLRKIIHLGSSPELIDDPAYELTIDCTFCAHDAEAIDRFEPCLTVLLEGPTGYAVTIMDGPFPSIYPWLEEEQLSSLTSASLTPFSKTCRTYEAAQQVLADVGGVEIAKRGELMLDQMARFWPKVRDLYRQVDFRTAVRAMPRSGADARLVDVVSVGHRAIRVRAGKIDAVFRAEQLVREWLDVRNQWHHVDRRGGVHSPAAEGAVLGGGQPPAGPAA